MDRNEAFRKRLDIKLYKGRSVGKGSFDPTPYVDILMEKTYYEDEDVNDLQEFIADVMTDPDFDFIFGQSSLLNTEQKANTAAMLLQRVDAALDFDPFSHAKDLIDIYGTPTFDKYVEIDEDGDECYNFNAYYAEYNFTKEQKELVLDTFIDLQNAKTPKFGDIDSRLSKKSGFCSLLFVAVIIFVPPFFIPNLLQNLGALPSDAGWLLKIGVGVVSFIALFITMAKIILITANRVSKKLQSS
jgi:hypothetical protein